MAAEIIRVDGDDRVDRQADAVADLADRRAASVLAVKVKHPEKLDQIKVGDVTGDLPVAGGGDHRGAGVELSRVRLHGERD